MESIYKISHYWFKYFYELSSFFFLLLIFQLHIYLSHIDLFHSSLILFSIFFILLLYLQIHKFFTLWSDCPLISSSMCVFVFLFFVFCNRCIGKVCESYEKLFVISLVITLRVFLLRMLFAWVWIFYGLLFNSIMCSCF